jgi:hypothetical protein
LLASDETPSTLRLPPENVNLMRSLDLPSDIDLEFSPNLNRLFMQAMRRTFRIRGVSIARFRRLVATHCLWWCLAGVLLSVLQPFLFTHFRQDGWEDEPGFRIRNAESMSLFSPDDRESHRQELETTLYVPAAAHIDVPDAFQHGLDVLMALVGLLLPLAAVLLWPLLPPPRQPTPKPIRHTSGAPPPTALWRTQPPPTAPPLTT